MQTLEFSSPLAQSIIHAIHVGDVAALERLLEERPELANARVRGAQDCPSGLATRTLLHVATDWPGHFPNIATTIASLLRAGADVNAPFGGSHRETPLHWAASSDDVDALETLLDGGADIEAQGSVIGGGAPLANAVAFGMWNVARRLVERGAQTMLWQAAALGLLDRVRERFSGPPLDKDTSRDPRAAERPDEVTHAFWCACHGGQRATAEFLLARGADINWVGYDNLTPVEAARRSNAAELASWLEAQGGQTASQLNSHK